MKACAYYRMSSDRQDASIPDQRKHVTRYAKDHGYQIVRDYVDEGVSGDATEKRLAFQAMVADAGTGQWSLILCWDQDRFGRFDPIEGGFWIKPIRDAGVVLETVSQGRIDWSDFAGRIVWTVQQEAKHAYLKDLSRNVLRGHIENAKRGGRKAGMPPLGYEWDGDILVPNDDAETVRFIFRSTLAGESLRGIARQLGTTRRGTPWSANAVRVILNNPVYRGDYVWGVRKSGKYHQFVQGRIDKTTVQRSSVLTQDVVLIENRHEAIVTREDWQRCQESLKANRKATAPVASYLFSGLVVCGHCGGAAHGTIVDTHRYYVCSNRSNGCRYYHGRESRILINVVAKLMDVFGTQQRRDGIRKIVERKHRIALASVDIKAERAKLSAIDRKLEAGASRILAVSDDIVPIVQGQLTRLKAERDALAASIQSHEGVATRLSVTMKREFAELEHQAMLLPNLICATQAQQRAFLRSILSRVVLRWDTDDRGGIARHKLADISLEFRASSLGVL